MLLTTLITISLAFGTFSLNPMSGHAVSQPDFSGTWNLDRQQSTPVTDFDDLVLIISQTSVELRVKRVIKRNKHKERISEVIYYTDGRGEETPLLLTTDKWKSTTRWVDDKLLRKYRVTAFITGDVYYQDHTETWSLSSDRNLLTIDTEIIPGHVPPLWQNVIKDAHSHRVFRRG